MAQETPAPLRRRRRNPATTTRQTPRGRPECCTRRRVGREADETCVLSEVGLQVSTGAQASRRGAQAEARSQPRRRSAHRARRTRAVCVRVRGAPSGKEAAASRVAGEPTSATLAAPGLRSSGQLLTSSQAALRRCGGAATTTERASVRPQPTTHHRTRLASGGGRACGRRRQQKEGGVAALSWRRPCSRRRSFPGPYDSSDVQRRAARATDSRHRAGAVGGLAREPNWDFLLEECFEKRPFLDGNPRVTVKLPAS